MSDWKPGDMAVCIAKGPWCNGSIDNFIRGPRLNEIVTVTGVGSNEVYGFRYRTLLLKEWPLENGWEARAFRRIRPDIEPATDTTWLKIGETV